MEMLLKTGDRRAKLVKLLRIKERFMHFANANKMYFSQSMKARSERIALRGYHCMI